MKKPKLLDLFCGAGGCSVGYERAGFVVHGVDIKAQPHYPGEFTQEDALEFLLVHGTEYDAIHASPPCQAHCSLKKMWNAKPHKPLIEETRRLLEATGKPWVMENVVGTPLHNPVLLCGTMLSRRRLMPISVTSIEWWK